MRQVTFWQLIESLKTGKEITVLCSEAPSGRSYTGNLLAIEKEDGGGHCWNVTMLLSEPTYTGSSEVTFFVRTLD